jgi:hypothetical protein
MLKRNANQSHPVRLGLGKAQGDIALSINFDFVKEVNILRKEIAIDIGGDPSAMQTEMIRMAALWSVLMRKAFRVGAIRVAAEATHQARQCFALLGMNRKAKEVLEDTSKRPTRGINAPSSLEQWAQQYDASRELAARNKNGEGDSVQRASEEAAGEGDPTSAAPAALAHEGPWAEGNIDPISDTFAEGDPEATSEVTDSRNADFGVSE